MRMRYFGDSYDIVKQSLLRWLRPLGEWSVHPMFTEPVSPGKVALFRSNQRSAARKGSPRCSR